MYRSRACGPALAVLAFAACTDTQAPDDARNNSAPNPSALPLVSTLRSVAPTAALGGPPSEFEITLRFVNQPTTSQEVLFQSAASKWEGIISGDVPDVTGNFAKKSCGSSAKTPAFSGTIDDVLIDVLLEPIDGPGGVLASAGPCFVRNVDLLTVYGIMYFDTDDFARLETNGTLDEVVAHEMGHVLGFGTLWRVGRTLLEGFGTTDPRFVGPNAVAGYGKVGGAGTVPVEGDEGGAGTLYGHWDEATFDNELMTGFLRVETSYPLSIVTVGSMADLGYVVRSSAADRYRLPDAGAGVAALRRGDGVDLAAGERLVAPVGRVD